MTMAGTIWQAEMSTWRLNSWSSHSTSVLAVSFVTRGTSNRRQSQSLSHASRMVNTTIAICLNRGISDVVTPAIESRSSTYIFIDSMFQVYQLR